MYGVHRTSGLCLQVCFEVYITETLAVDFGEEHSEKDPHIVRIGWSVDSHNYQLGNHHHHHTRPPAGRHLVAAAAAAAATYASTLALPYLLFFKTFPCIYGFLLLRLLLFCVLTPYMFVF